MRVDRHGCCVSMATSFLWARLSLVEDEQRGLSPLDWAAKNSCVLSSCSGTSFTGGRHIPQWVLRGPR